MATLINAVVPPGWLPLGAMTLGSGNVVPALLGTLGLTLIGSASLWRAYRTTLRLYKGEFTSGKGRTVAPSVKVKPARPTDLLVERKLPWDLRTGRGDRFGRLPLAHALPKEKCYY